VEVKAPSITRGDSGFWRAYKGKSLLLYPYDRTVIFLSRNKYNILQSNYGDDCMSGLLSVLGERLSKIKNWLCINEFYYKKKGVETTKQKENRRKNKSHAPKPEEQEGMPQHEHCLFSFW
jgi:hypothetical protein